MGIIDSIHNNSTKTAGDGSLFNPLLNNEQVRQSEKLTKKKASPESKDIKKGQNSFLKSLAMEREARQRARDRLARTKSTEENVMNQHHNGRKLKKKKGGKKN